MRAVSNFWRADSWLQTACIVLLSSATICAAQTSEQLSPSSPAGSAGIQSSVPAAESLAAKISGGDSSIRLGTGDLIEISVYGVPELNTKTRISDAGEIYLPLINYVHVGGLTIDDAGRVIEKQLEQGDFVRSPHVQLMVDESASNGASILGEVVKPGVYPVIGDQTLFNLISAAGGLSDRAGKSITISHHDSPDKPVSVTISRNFDDHPESNVPVYAGDTIMVRRADVIYVVGEVVRPSGFLMDNNNHLTVLQAVALAGGTAPNAKLDGARILRKGPSGVTEVPVPLKKLLQAKVEDIPLQAEDILFVPTSSKKILSGRTAAAALQMATAVSIVAIRP
jgi:polysaccharide export outer membrane protein